MRIILSFSDAYQLGPAGRDEREYTARQQFADAGVKLDTRSCHMVWAGNDPALTRTRTRDSLADIVNRWRDGDLAYTDHEPDNFSMHKQFKQEIVNDHVEIVNASKFALPGDNNVSVYGMPYSRWWGEWSTPQAFYGLSVLHKSTKLGWFGPQFYQPYNLGDKNGIDNLKRVLTIKNTCRMIDASVPVYPFVQPVLRHPQQDYREMDDDTIFDMWASLAWAGIDTVIWWYESGPRGQLMDGHADRIARHASIMQDAIASAFPVGG